MAILAYIELYLSYMPHLASNKQAKFQYHLLEKMEAGINLTGPEVKSAKRGEISLKGSYVSLRPTGAWLIHTYIAPYKPAKLNQTDYDPYRDRRLLLRREEISRLVGLSQSRGLTIVPISFYTKGGFVKVELAVARGKRLVDKRRSIKEREIKVKINRALRAKP